MSTTIDLKEHPAVKALAAHQARVSETDVGFARRYLGLSASTWGLIKNGKYAAMVKDPDKILEACEAALRVLDDAQDRSQFAGESARILQFDHVAATLAAVKGCYGKPQNRFVVFLAPTGGGKTTVSRAIQENYLSAAIRVEASESWRKSYFAAAVTIARAAGYTESYPVTQGPAKVEADLMSIFGVEGRVLVIDEGHYCGPAALNLLKFLLNRTTCRIVLVAIPELWERMEKAAYKEVEQLRRRTAAKIILATLTPADVKKFLTARLPGFADLGDETKEVVNLCCTAANKFGYFDTLDRICTEFATEAGGRPASLELVKAALKRVEALRS